MSRFEGPSIQTHDWHESTWAQLDQSQALPVASGSLARNWRSSSHYGHWQSSEIFKASIVDYFHLFPVDPIIVHQYSGSDHSISFHHQILQDLVRSSSQSEAIELLDLILAVQTSAPQWKVAAIYPCWLFQGIRYIYIIIYNIHDHSWSFMIIHDHSWSYYQ